MRKIIEKKNELIETICTGKVYNRYEEARKEINAFPEKKAQVDWFRREGYRMAVEHGDDPEEVRLLLEKRADLKIDPVIAEYLDSELDLCRILQRICMEILNVADLELEAFADIIRD